MPLWCVRTKTGEIYCTADKVDLQPDGSMCLLNVRGKPEETHAVLCLAAGNWTAVFPVQSDRQPNFDFVPYKKTDKVPA